LEPDEKVVVDKVLLAQLKVRGFTAWLGAQLGADRSTLD
jgi:phage pi2 protein 07